MSALAVLPRPVTAPAGEPVRVTTPRRGHLTLVRPGVDPAGRLAVPSPRPTPRGPATARPMRLTRRGRRLLVGVVLVLATASSVGVGALAGQAASAGTGPQDAVTVSVAPGDTLWGLAATVAGPEQDVREVVERIVATNDLSSHELRAGQRLQLPG